MSILKQALLSGRSFDADLRYKPIVSFLRKHYTKGDTIFEVGSGNYGLTPYFAVPIIGADIPEAFDEQKSPLVEKKLVEGVRLPDADNTYDFVVSVDMLEHVTAEDRVVAMNEMIRIAKKYVLFTVPTSEESQEQDKELYNYYLAQHGTEYPFLKEHLEYGLPTADILREILTSNQKATSFQIIPNVNLDVRKMYMKLWITKGFVSKALFKLLSYFSFLGPFLNYGKCYRSVVIVSMS